MAFLKIGGSVGFGGLYGGVSGLFQGLKETSNLKGNVRRTQWVLVYKILNVISLNG